ncbi:hypothetical protein F0344_22595 [Streptomyces finlayi]|uniref:Uncharacterized protein n=1 Tax=Streptomyces finlayi TaxID=67296 RepID=A0A7G7BNW5_9ACTN|nr:hypothetical protein [Streptomyces finlayi]QNE77030.1 hypothetical protein F0344_22595 [Streptomyces finlayi]
MENWREGTRTGHTHEPNEVTLQLDGLGRQLSELAIEPGTPDSSDNPVFVDESGRRSKSLRRVGWLLAAICAGYAVTLVVALLGGSSHAPWLPITGQPEKSAEVEVQPAPTEPVGPEASPGPATPSATPSDLDAPGSGAPQSANGADPVPAGSAPATRAPLPTVAAPDEEAAASSSAPAAPVPAAPAPGSSSPVEPESPAPPVETTVPPVDEQEGAP